MISAKNQISIPAVSELFKKEVPHDLWGEIVEKAVINIGVVRLLHQKWLKIGSLGTTK